MKAVLLKRFRYALQGGADPILFETSFNDTLDEATFSTTELGTIYWATHLTTESVSADGSGGFTGTTLETGSVIITEGSTTFPVSYTTTTGTTGNTRRVSYYLRNESGRDSNLIVEQFTVN